MKIFLRAILAVFLLFGSIGSGIESSGISDADEAATVGDPRQKSSC